jgi:excisionase family DNA binding protein
VRGISETPSGAFRVQKPRYRGADAVDRAQFDTRAEAERWALACDQARSAGNPNPDPGPFRAHAPSPARRTTVDEFAAKVLAARASDLEHNDTAVTYADMWRRHGKEPLGAKWVDEVEVGDVRAVRNGMRDAGHAASYQNTFLAVLRDIFNRSIEQNLRQVNPAKGVSAKEPHNPLKRPDDAEPVPVTLVQAKTIAAAMPAQHRLALWLLLICALRISEAFGLRLRSWDPAALRLNVKAQGGRWFWVGPNRRTRGKDIPKTEASDSWLIVPQAMAAALNDYIEDNHGARPDDSDPGLQHWLDRRLLIGPRTRTPSQETWRQTYDKARDSVGLGRDRLGYTIAPHFLRKSCLTWLDGEAGVTGRALSRWARHKLNKPTDGQASITAAKYILATIEGLQSCADALDRLIADQIGDLAIDGRSSADDLYSVAEAAGALGVGITTVRALLAQGRLWPAGPDAAGAWKDLPGAGPRTVLIPAEAVLSERARRDRDAADETLSASQAAALLRAPIGWVDAALHAGTVPASKTDTGHSWRLTPADVDVLDELWQQHRRPVRGMVSAADAAARLATSRRRVKQLVAEGRLTGHVPEGRCALWIDTASLDQHLALTGKTPHAPGQSADAGANAACVDAAARDGRPPLTTAQAAALMGVSRARVRELVDDGTLHAERDGDGELARLKIDPASAECERDRRLAGGKRRTAPPPDGTVDAETAAAALGRSVQTVLRLAAEGTVPSTRRGARVFLDAAAVADGARARADGVPLRQAAAELGANPVTVAGLARRGALDLALGYRSDRKGAVTRESLDRYLARTGPAPLRTGQVAARLGISHAQVRRLVDAGELGAQRLGKTTFVIAEADVARLERLGPQAVAELSASAPRGWVRGVDAAAALGTTPNALQHQYAAGKIPGTVRSGGLWLDPATVRDRAVGLP